MIEEPRQSKTPVERIAECRLPGPTCGRPSPAKLRPTRRMLRREVARLTRVATRLTAGSNRARRIDRVNRSDPAERLCGER